MKRNGIANWIYQKPHRKERVFCLIDCKVLRAGLGMASLIFPSQTCLMANYLSLQENHCVLQQIGFIALVDKYVRTDRIHIISQIQPLYSIKMLCGF